MSQRLARFPALFVLLAPASALAQVSLKSGPSTARMAGWAGLGVVQLGVLAALAYFLAKTYGRTGEAFRMRAMVLSGVAFALGIATVVMADTEPVVQKRLLSQDTVDLIEMLGYAEIALGAGCGLLAYYAAQVAAAFAPPERQVQVDELPPPVEPARRSLRRRQEG